MMPSTYEITRSAAAAEAGRRLRPELAARAKARPRRSRAGPHIGELAHAAIRAGAVLFDAAGSFEPRPHGHVSSLFVTSSRRWPAARAHGHRHQPDRDRWRCLGHQQGLRYCAMPSAPACSPHQARGPLGDQLRNAGDEFGATGRPRDCNCGWLDLPAPLRGGAGHRPQARRAGGDARGPQVERRAYVDELLARRRRARRGRAGAQPGAL